MFYASVLFTCGLVMAILGSYEYGTVMYGTVMVVAGIVCMFIGIIVGLKIECNIDGKKTFEEERFKELKRLVEAQSKQIDLLKQEIKILKHR